MVIGYPRNDAPWGKRVRGPAWRSCEKLMTKYNVILHWHINIYSNKIGRQDELNHVLWMTTLASKITWSCLLWITRFVPQENNRFFPYNKSCTDYWSRWLDSGLITCFCMFMKPPTSPISSNLDLTNIFILFEYKKSAVMSTQLYTALIFKLQHALKSSTVFCHLNKKHCSQMYWDHTVHNTFKNMRSHQNTEMHEHNLDDLKCL